MLILKDLVSKLGVNLEMKCMVIGRKFPRGLSIERTCQLIGGIFLSRQDLRKRRRRLGVTKEVTL